MSERQQLNRRSFLRSVGAGLVTAGAIGAAARAAEKQATGPAEGSAGRMKKAVKLGMVEGQMPLLEKFKLLKELGFDGVELDAPSALERDEVLRARDASGLPIPGVVVSTHWVKPLSSPDPAVRKQGLDGLLAALREAKAYGASTALLVPAVVSKEISYADAYRRSQEEIRKAIPLAQELGVTIAAEDVWNNFLLSPLEMARYIDEFGTPFVRVHFDVGNIVRYGWPEHWIEVLGRRIVKLDIKEYSRKKQADEGLYKGFEVELLEGDCDWPAVMKALRAIGYPEYSGWATAEITGGDRRRLKDIADRMDRIFAS